MIHFLIGTKAQLIKTAPVMLELRRRGIPIRDIDTGQHSEFTAEIRRDFQMPPPDYCLTNSNEDITTYSKASNWLRKAVTKWAFDRKGIRKEVFGGESGICVTHGDTASTLIGTAFARRAGLEVAHLESGLRSFKYFDPFPEELIRIHCMKRSAILFAPDEKAEANLKRMRVRGRIVATRGNTVADSIRLAGDSFSPENDEPYILATFHRLETLRSSERLDKLIESLNVAAEQCRVKFVMHKPTEACLTKRGLLDQLSQNVERLPMQSYPRFIGLMKHAECVLADGGSIQEECALLGIPLLVLRSNSERSDGIGQNARFASFDLEQVRAFLKTYQALRQAPNKSSLHPSEIVADELQAAIQHCDQLVNSATGTLTS